MEGGFVGKMYDTIPTADTILDRFRHETDTNPRRVRNDSDTIPKQRNELFTKETLHEWSIKHPCKGPGGAKPDHASRHTVC